MAKRMVRVCAQNPAYLEFRGKPTALVTSGEHYGAVLNVDFDQVRYLDTLAADGLNLTRVFSGAYRETWGTGWNTLNPAPERFLAPWARSAPGEKFDLARWDERYWQRLRGFVREASRRRIVVEYVLFCVWYGDAEWNASPMNARNNVNGIGLGTGPQFFGETEPALMAAQAALARKAAAELSSFDNVYFELCNEPYFDGPALAGPWNLRIAAALRSVRPQAMIALNVANGSQRVDRMPPGVDVLNFHYAAPPTALDENASLRCPVAFDESGFRGTDPVAYRTEAWEFLLAGGAAYSGLDWSFEVGKEDGTGAAADERLGPRSPALRKSLGALARFVNGLDLRRIRPRQDLLRALPEGVAGRMLADPGREYALYLHHPQAKSVPEVTVALEAGRYRVAWTNPETGDLQGESVLAHRGGTAALPVPAHRVDRALLVHRMPGGRVARGATG